LSPFFTLEGLAIRSPIVLMDSTDLAEPSNEVGQSQRALDALHNCSVVDFCLVFAFVLRFHSLGGCNLEGPHQVAPSQQMLRSPQLLEYEPGRGVRDGQESESEKPIERSSAMSIRNTHTVEIAGGGPVNVARDCSGCNNSNMAINLFQVGSAGFCERQGYVVLDQGTVATKKPAKTGEE
jgi:hypothetical protein